MAAGAVGALMVIGWVWPTLGEGDSWIIARSTIIPRSRSIEVSISKTTDTVFTLYQKSSRSGLVTYLSESDKLSSAVMAVSEGWVVAYVPNYSGNFKDWRLIGSHGGVYTVTRVLFDDSVGMVYAKITALIATSVSPEQFKVATFNEVPSVYGDLYVYQDGAWFSTAYVDRAYEAVKDGHAETLFTGRYILQNSFKTGSLVADSQGRVVGFVENGTAVVPTIAIGRVLSGIEAKTKLTATGLGVQGWFSEEQPIVVSGVRRSGYLVAKVINKKSALKKGDIIVLVNGRSMEPDNLWYTNGDTSVRLQIWRDGKTVEIDAPVVTL